MQSTDSTFLKYLSPIKMKWIKNPTPWIIFGFNNYHFPECRRKQLLLLDILHILKGGRALYCRLPTLNQGSAHTRAAAQSGEVMAGMQMLCKSWSSREHDRTWCSRASDQRAARFHSPTEHPVSHPPS